MEIFSRTTYFVTKFVQKGYLAGPRRQIKRLQAGVAFVREKLLVVSRDRVSSSVFQVATTLAQVKALDRMDGNVVVWGGHGLSFRVW